MGNCHIGTVDRAGFLDAILYENPLHTETVSVCFARTCCSETLNVPRKDVAMSVGQIGYWLEN